MQNLGLSDTKESVVSVSWCGYAEDVGLERMLQRGIILQKIPIAGTSLGEIE